MKLKPFQAIANQIDHARYSRDPGFLTITAPMERRITAEAEFLFGAIESHILHIKAFPTRKKRIKELVAYITSARASCIGVWERLAQIEDREKFWLEIAARTRNLETQAMLDYAVRRLQFRWLRRHVPALLNDL